MFKRSKECLSSVKSTNNGYVITKEVYYKTLSSIFKFDFKYTFNLKVKSNVDDLKVMLSNERNAFFESKSKIAIQSSSTYIGNHGNKKTTLEEYALQKEYFEEMKRSKHEVKNLLDKINYLMEQDDEIVSYIAETTAKKWTDELGWIDLSCSTEQKDIRVPLCSGDKTIINLEYFFNSSLDVLAKKEIKGLNTEKSFISF